MSFRGTAVHEAGHAAAALALPLPCRVWIDASGPRLDGARYGGAIEAPSAVVPYAWALAVVLAGPAAQVLDRAGARADLDLYGSDVVGARVASAGALWIGRGEAVRAVYGWLEREDVWPVVDAIAGELLRRQQQHGGRGEIGPEELPAVAFAGWTRTLTPGLVREWGQPLRRAFPPCAPGTPGVERAILRGVVPQPTGRPSATRTAAGTGL